LIHTDCLVDGEYDIDNVKIVNMSKDIYIEKVSKKLKVNFKPENDYKFCDIKPMYGVLHEDEIDGFDFYGYGDIDVIYGNIRKFYTDQVLENNIISTHSWCLSGHLSLFRNVDWIRNAFRRYNEWRMIVENPKNLRFDEDSFIKVFSYPVGSPLYIRFYDILHPLSWKYRTKRYLREQFTTPLTPSAWRNGRQLHPEVWYWRQGTLTNELDGRTEFIYLHFMNFISGRWMSSHYRERLLWRDREKIIFVTPQQMRQNGLKIDWYGFHALQL